MNQERIKKVETMEKAMKPRMTAVFECDLRRFEGNPHLQDTPFGRAVTLSVGDALEAADLPSKVNPLTEQDRAEIIEAAYQKYRKHHRGGASGQLISEWDGIEIWVVQETERRILSAIEG